MTRGQAIDKLMEELRWPSNYRCHMERIVLNLTDSADSLDRETYEAVKQSILNL